MGVAHKTLEKWFIAQAYIRSLPQGLVGPRCMILVYVEGIPCESILGTGSQVMTIQKSFIHSTCHPQPIQSIPLS